MKLEIMRYKLKN